MKNKNIIRFANSLVFLPVMTMSLAMGGVSNNGIYSGVSQNALIQKLNIVNQSPEALVLKQAADLEVVEQKAKADAIDAYFKAHEMPLEGTGMKMVLEAKKNELDWRLLPAITVRESTGGQFSCVKKTFNAFGWGSCKIGFSSNEEAIETVAKNLGGNNPSTAMFYANKNTKQILRAYNPPSIVPKYAEQVIAIMNDIGEADAVPTTTANT